ncbi:hypothetical protein QBC41DRAFT_316019 [Cercophora samala]|uniref:2EXR domain-containing protein n=1 Tax=Cercophora samala TaxID=330535 RepID=A0AA39ZHY8_9PEZI|nr:hypothetical protein QBC41DRAFT_316019 [Cercophora samala]
MPTKPTPSADEGLSQNMDFKAFPRLPADIRQEIWTSAASTAGSDFSGSPTPRISFFTEQHMSRDNKNISPPRLVVQEPYNQALLRTNTEAHDVALMSAGPIRDYNPETDILYMTTSNAFCYFTRHESCQIWASKVQHIALPLGQAGVWGEIPAYTREPGRLPALKTISIVFPASSGTFSCFQPMEQPDEQLQKMALRQLTDAELAEITVKSQFDYSTWAGDLPFNYSNTGTEYLAAYGEAVKREAKVVRVSQQYSMKEGMMIQWEGRCFESWRSRKRYCDQDRISNLS